MRDQTFHYVDVHSGVLLGISGGLDKQLRLWTLIGQLGFYFLEDVVSIDVQMEVTSQPDPSAIAPVLHGVVRGDNRGNNDVLTIDL